MNSDESKSCPTITYRHLKNNPIEHPSHYNIGTIEAIDVIEDWGFGFHKGNCLKYLCRAGIKDPSKEIEDLEKAAWYLNRYINLLKEKEKISD